MSYKREEKISKTAQFVKVPATNWTTRINPRTYMREAENCKLSSNLHTRHGTLATAPTPTHKIKSGKNALWKRWESYDTVLFISIFVYVYDVNVCDICMCMQAHTCQSVHLEVRGQLWVLVLAFYLV